MENVETAPVESNTPTAPVTLTETTENAEGGNTPDNKVEASETPSEAPETVVSDKFLENFNLEDLLSADFSGDEIMNNTHKDLPSYQEVLKHLPENGRKLISNLRAMTTRKTQEVAEIRKQLEAERAQLQQEKQALYNGKFAENINELAKEPEKPFDLYTDEGMEAKIKQEAAKMFQQMMAPVQEDMRLQQRQVALDNFTRDNPDIKHPEVRVEVAKLLRDRPELKLEDAYYITKAKLDRSKLEELEQQRLTKRNDQREAWNKVSNGSNARPTKAPKFRSAWEAYQYHKQNGVK